MHISSPTSPKPPDPKSILLIGPPGGGKTTLAMQFPNVCFIDCDRNLDGPERFLRSKNAQFSYAYVSATIDEKGNPYDVADCFDWIIVRITELAKEASIQTVVIDGLTLINEYIIRKILKKQGGKSVMEPHFWGPFKSDMLKLLVQTLRGLNKTTIVTCHEVVLEKPNTDKDKMLQPLIIGYRPAVQGGITDYLGGFFSDMWRCTSQPGAGNKQTYKLQVVRDGLSDLKNSLALPSEGFTWSEGELGYERIKPYIEKV